MLRRFPRLPVLGKVIPSAKLRLEISNHNHLSLAIPSTVHQEPETGQPTGATLTALAP